MRANCGPSASCHTFTGFGWHCAVGTLGNGARDCMGRHQSATELVWLCNTQEELARSRGCYTMTAYLDCSKCYERIRHVDAQEAAHRTRCPVEIMNLALNMYSGRRRLKVRGCLSQGFFPTSGLLAGCARARDLLQSVLGPILTSGTDSQARIYVDDIALTVEGPTPLAVVQRMKG